MRDFPAPNLQSRFHFAVFVGSQIGDSWCLAEARLDLLKLADGRRFLYCSFDLKKIKYIINF